MDNLSRKNKLKKDIRSPGELKLFSQKNLEGMLFLLTDTVALGCSWHLVASLNKFYSPIPTDLVWWIWLGIPSLFWLFSLANLFAFVYGGLYSNNQHNYVRTAQLISLVYLSSLVLSYFYDPKLDLPRSVFFTAWLGSIILVLGFRLFVTLIWRQLVKKKQLTVFIIARSHRLKKLAEVLQKSGNHRIVGAALSSTVNTNATFKAILASKAQEVLAEDLPESKLASTLYWQLRANGINLRLIPSSVEILYRRGVPEVFAGMPTLRVETHLLIGWDYFFKRCLDLVGASVGVIVLMPLFMGTALAIKLTSPGPIFFRQERMGLNNKVFYVWKFRTMGLNAQAMQQELEAQNQSKDKVMFKVKDDPRIIPIGHFLRRTSIDELPQLFNVLLGEMSLVGPRPLPLRDIQRFQDWHHIRHCVLPGITGLWQISGRSDIDDFEDAIRLDLYYIDNWSVNLDLDILIETVRIVLFGKGAY